MIDWTEISIRLALSAVLGGIIGVERERKEKGAGFRTHMMVCIGSALAMLVSIFGFSDVHGNPQFSIDPSRVAAQVVSGIGFIGAGAILFLKQSILRGLTTAAGLWTVAAIGLAAGGGMYYAAVATTILSIIILWVLQPLEKVFSKIKAKSVIITTENKEASSEIIDKMMKCESAEIDSYSVNRNDDEYVILFELKNPNSKEVKDIINNFESDSGIKEVMWNK